MAAGATYEPIATQTLGSAAASITFSSIAASWTDLRVVIVATADTATRNQITFNSDSGSNYSRTYLFGNGSATSTGTNSNGTLITADAGSISTTIPQLISINLFSYAGSTYKSILWDAANDNNGSGNVYTGVGLWRNTAAITSITLTAGGNNYAIGTKATLYGIKAA
jgi:hypothetical protein